MIVDTVLEPVGSKTKPVDLKATPAGSAFNPVFVGEEDEVNHSSDKERPSSAKNTYNPRDPGAPFHAPAPRYAVSGRNASIFDNLDLGSSQAKLGSSQEKPRNSLGGHRQR